MRHSLRALALACTLAWTPACAALHFGSGSAISNPADAAQTADQRAYALLASYAALVETATGIIREPNVPVEAKRALGRAEAVATPAVHTLEAAFAAYLRTRSAFEASAEADQSGVSRAAAALSAASQALSDAIEAARAPIADLQALVEAPKH